MSTPFLKKRKNSSCNMKRDVLLYTSFRKNGGLAQLVRASASHAEGRRFESATLHQKQQAAIQAACCFCGEPRADPARPQAGESALAAIQESPFAFRGKRAFSVACFALL